MTRGQRRSRAFEVVKRYTSRPLAPPVRVDSIAKDLGIPVYHLSLGPKIVGKLARDDDSPSGFNIFVDNQDPLARQRFTLAHELAHFILHADLVHDGVVDDEMYRSALGGYYETQANRLAADILMPFTLIKELLEEGHSEAELPALFDVSRQAMEIRLSYMPGAVPA